LRFTVSFTDSAAFRDFFFSVFAVSFPWRPS
jgi:hypothetical protein